MLAQLEVKQGLPEPFGTSFFEEGVNFAIYSHLATDVTLCLFNFNDLQPLAEIPLNPDENKTGDVWHIHIKGIPENVCYAYRFEKNKGKAYKQYFKKENLILDPFAKGVNTTSEWGLADKPYQPLGLISSVSDFDWENDRPLNIPLKDLIIYEMHVRGFTHHSSSGVNNPGTFLGVIEKIPYLQHLGINAVKLLPIQEFNECEFSRFNPFTGQRLYNFWGYSTVNFFSPMNRYASGNQFHQASNEFKMMVKELHKNGIEVILDVVFNHTAEGNEEGPIYSFKGIDCPTYYILDHQQHTNYTGCGNTVNCNHPIIREFIKNCLHYWVSEMHVDGFRFDLAGIFMRGKQGEVLNNPPIIEELSQDPILADTKLIAEPWDAAGIYKLGQFYPQQERWSEWNGKYRDSVRRFIKGDRGENRQFAIRISGSNDLFESRSPIASINFINAHDGFTLYDLVSYNQKNNSPNAEDDRDGNTQTLSWNCGFEGETDQQDVLDLRERQMKNFHLALLISQGIPMLHMGNEYGHTRYGNNNAWCQDNESNWFLWDHIQKREGFFRFYRSLNHFRKKYEVFRFGRFLTEEDIDWHSIKPFDPNWESDTQMIAFTLKDPQGKYFVYLAFNMHHQPLEIEIPDPLENNPWKVIVDTAKPPPADFNEEGQAPNLDQNVFTMDRHSSILLFSSKE